MPSSNASFLRVTGAVLTVSAIGLALACGGGSSKPPQTIVPSGQNVAQLSVNSGVTGTYANGVFTTVTVCVPGSSTCQTINNILVDTGSIGLRLLDAASGGPFNLSLPQANNSSNAPYAECTRFLDGSYLWGSVRTADIKISGETASSVPVDIFGDSAFPTVPSTCSQGGNNANNLNTFGANGVLGVNVFVQDCGPFCVSGMTIPTGLYYSCPTSGCVPAFIPLAQQVSTPVAFFSTDNNGVIVELPSVSSSGQVSTTGSLVFGIGTQSNNALGSATVIPLDGAGHFTTSFKGANYSQSFVDTGSNGYFFLDSTTTGIPVCSDAKSFYCPSSTQNLSATNMSTVASGSTSVNFSVANADNLFNSSNFVFNNLAGPNPNSFDWGLPFYYGRNVFEVLENATVSGHTGPFVAY